MTESPDTVAHELGLRLQRAAEGVRHAVREASSPGDLRRRLYRAATTQPEEHQRRVMWSVYHEGRQALRELDEAREAGRRQRDAWQREEEEAERDLGALRARWTPPVTLDAAVTEQPLAERFARLRVIVAQLTGARQRLTHEIAMVDDLCRAGWDALSRIVEVTLTLDRERVYDTIRQEWRRAWGDLAGLREAAHNGEAIVREVEAHTGRRLAVPTITLPLTAQQWEAVGGAGPEWRTPTGGSA